MNIGTIEGLLRLKDEFSTTLRNATKNLGDAGARMQEVGGRISSAGSGITALTAPIAALAAVSIKSAITFESSFTGVRKTLDTTGLSASQAEAEFAKLEKGLRSLAAGPNAVPVDVNQLNAIAEAAGQLGIARGDIVDFTRTVADLAQTTNLAAEEGATSLAQFQNIFGAVGKDVDRLGSTIVALGNSGASTERDIVSMGLRIAGAGSQIGLSQGQVLAFASSLSSMGIEAEAGGSAISKVMIDIAIAVTKGGRELKNFAAVAGISATDFQRLFKQDAASAITAFIEGLGRMKASGQDVLGTLDKMGITEVRMRDALLRASGAGNLLRDSLNLQARAWRDNNALQNEAAQRYKTTESQLRIVWNRLKDQAITIGQSLLPAVLDLLKALEPLVELAGRWARAFALLPSPVRNTIIVVGALAVAIGPLLIVTGQLISAWGSVIALAPKMASAIALATGPWGLIAAAIVAATAAIVIWIDKWREASEEAIALSVKLGNLEGAALSFYQQIKASGGKVQDTVLAQAWKDADQYSRALLEAQKRLEDLKAKQSSSSNIDPRLGTPRVDYSAQIAEEERNVAKLSATYEKQKAALRGVTEVIKTETSPSLEDLLAGLQVNSGAVNILTEDMEKLGKQLAELRQDLALSTRQSLQLARAYAQLAPPETIAAIKRAHALETAFLQDVRVYGRDAALSLQLLRAADYDAAQQAARSEAAWNQYTEAIKRSLAALAQAAGNRLFEEMVRNAERQLAKLEQTAAELQRRLRLAGDLRRDVEYEIRISTVDEVTPRLRNIEEAYISFLRDMGEGSVSRGEEIMRAMEGIFGGFIASVRADLATLEDVRIADRVKGAASANASPLAIYRAERAEIVRIMRDSTSKLLKSARDQADAWAYLDQLFLDSITSYIAGWQQFFSVIGNLFGGFAAKAASVLQQMISTYQATQSAGSAIGGQAGALISSAGPFLAIAGAIIGLQRESAARDRARQYTSSASVGFETGGQYETAGRRGRELASALDAALTPLLDLIDRTAASLPEIVVHAREDGRGFAAHINDVFLGYFATLEDAIDAATIAALQQIGPSLSETMRTVLANTLATTSEGLQADLETGVRFENLGLDDVAIRVQEMFDDFRHMMEDVARLGLDTGKVKVQFGDDLRAFINDLLGFNSAASDALARLVDINRVLAEQTGQMREQAEQRLASMREELAAMAAGPRTFTGEDGRRGHTESREAWERARADLEREIERTLTEIEKLPRGLSDIEINMGVFDTLFSIIEGNDKLSAKYAEEAAKYARIKVEAEIAALEMQLRALGKWEEFAAMFADVAAFMRETAGETGRRGRRGGGGSSERDSARDFVRDRSFELSLRGLSDYQRQLRETTRQYDTLIAQAGKDNQLRAQLIALREQEMALIRKEQIASTVAAFQEFLGLANQFDEVRKTAADLIARINDSPFGDARKATMIGRVMARLEEQLLHLSRQSAVGLFGELLSDLQALGATEEQMAGARAAMAFLEHTLKMEHYRTEIELLKAQGKLAPEIIRALEDSLALVEDLAARPVGAGVPGAGAGSGGPNDPYAWVKGGSVFRGYEDAASTIQSVGDSLAEMTELLAQYRDQGLSPYQRALRDLNADFARIRAVLGDTAEVSAEYQLALTRLRAEYTESLTSLQERLTGGDLSGISIDTKFAQSVARWEKLSTALAGGDLSLSDDYVEEAERALELISRIGGTTAGGYGDLAQRIEEDLAGVLGTGGVAGVGTGAGASAGAGLKSVVADGSTQIVGSINTHGTRQEQRLDMMIARLDRIAAAAESPRHAGSSRYLYPPASSIMIGDAPFYPMFKGYT